MINRITDSPATIKFPQANSNRLNTYWKEPKQLAASSSFVSLRHPMIVSGITYKIADSREEREQAFRLVHDSYVEAHLIQPDSSGMRITPYHFQDMTDMFVAKDGDEVIYTMTLIGDNMSGLPLEMIYEREVARLRQSTMRIGEVSCLASKRTHFDQRAMFDIFTKLVGLMFCSAQHNGLEKLLVAVHPRHARFYQRMLGFREFGPLRSYSSVQGNPAIACLHDFDEANNRGYRLQNNIYGIDYPKWQLERCPMDYYDAEYFGSFNQSNELTFAAA